MHHTTFGTTTFARCAVRILFLAAGSLAPQSMLASSAAAQAQGPLQVPTLEPVGVFGCLACTGPDLFGRIIKVSAGPGSSFAVLTGEEPFVRLFDLDPPSARQFGRRGGGPGEFRLPMGIILLEDSVLVAHHRGASSAIPVLSIDGTPSDGQPLIARSEVRGFRSSPSGQWIAWSETVPGEARARVVRRSVATGAMDTLDISPWVLEGATDPRAYAELSVAVSDSGTVAIGYGKVAYRIELVPLNGGATRGGRRVPPRPYTEDEIEDRRQTLARIIGADRSSALTEDQPEYHPFFLSDALRFDSKNRLWVRPAPYRFNDDGDTVFDLFDSSLQFLGEVQLGHFAMDHDIGKDLFIAFTFGEMGIHQVRVFRLADP